MRTRRSTILGAIWAASWLGGLGCNWPEGLWNRPREQEQAAPQHQEEQRLVKPIDVTVDRTFDEGVVMRVESPSDDGAIVVRTDGVVLDLGGAELVGAGDDVTADRFTGRGIVVHGAKNVTIRRAVVRGFKVGIYAEDAPGLRIEGCDVSRNYRQRLKSTPQRENLDDWLFGHENDDNQWLRYGAGVYCLRCPTAVLRDNRARSGQNGLCLVRCDDAVVAGNDLSFMSGWGLAMWRSSRCRVVGNRFDFCVRGYSHGVYERGQDSTGILVYEQCSDNVFAYNSATHGGDGFFLYAGNETVTETGEGGCNRNLLYMNDFSDAVANGIEATFSAQNVFIGNTLNRCVHGVWAGYSTDSVICGNEIEDCRNGVSIEHGRRNVIAGNRLRRGGVGVHVWWDDDAGLLASPYCQKHGGDSRGERVLGNAFVDCRTAIKATDSRLLDVEGNIFTQCATAILASGKASFAKVAENVFDDGTIENKSETALNGSGNFLAASVTATGEVNWREPAAQREDAPALGARAALSHIEVNYAVGMEAARTLGLPVVRAGVPDRLGTEPFGPLPGVPKGKEAILIDDWGPYDFAQPRLFPAHAVCWGEATVRVLGPRRGFKVAGVEGDVSVTPTEGVTPAVVTIRRASAQGSGATPFAARFRVDDQTLSAEGMLLKTDWEISYYAWSPEKDPRRGDDNWRKIVSAGAIRREIRDRIDLLWQSRGPAPSMSGDYFAAVATTTMDLPAGRWTFRTISDDGVRLYVDGHCVIDDWTWHIPTEDRADVDLSAGPHRLRIEYFEIDGNAQLQLLIEPCAR